MMDGWIDHNLRVAQPIGVLYRCSKLVRGANSLRGDLLCPDDTVTRPEAEFDRPPPSKLALKGLLRPTVDSRDC